MTRLRKLLVSALALTASFGAPIGHAEVFYSGQTKGQRGDFVELILNARALRSTATSSGFGMCTLVGMVYLQYTRGHASARRIVSRRTA